MEPETGGNFRNYAIEGALPWLPPLSKERRHAAAT
jgi:hypothetical protein